MTPNLLDELEEVKWLRDAAAGIALEGHAGWGNACLFGAECIERLQSALADMAKRMEAAERDARRYRFIESAPSGTVRADFVSWLPAYFHFGNGISLGEQLDAAIDATQEGEA